MNNNSIRTNHTTLTRSASRSRSLNDFDNIYANALQTSVSINNSSKDKKFEGKHERKSSRQETSTNTYSILYSFPRRVGEHFYIMKSHITNRIQLLLINYSTSRSIITSSFSHNRKLIAPILVVFVLLAFLFLFTFTRTSFFGIRNIINSKSPQSTAVLLYKDKHRYPISINQNEQTGPWIIATIADLDKESCHLQKNKKKYILPVSCGRANVWLSYYKRGILSIEQPIFGSRKKIQASVKWLDETKIIGRGHLEVQREDHGQYGGRGMELSELEWFFGHLLTPDDHTGMLLEIMSPRGLLLKDSTGILTEGMSAIPPSTLHRAVLLDGPGNDTEKFFKSEWMVVKDDKLIIGGHGRAFTAHEDGSKIISTNPTWVKVVDRNFQVSHENWNAKFEAVANSVGVKFPGYLMHEAVLWSQQTRKWIFLPRRKSIEPYDSAQNERKGSNIVIIADEQFKEISTMVIKGLQDDTGLKGFSSAKFVPGKRDEWIVALRTIEIDNSATSKRDRRTESFISVFDISSGKMILQEQLFSNKKYEGLVFL